MGKPLTPERATKLASALSGRDSMYANHGAVRVYVEDDRIVFELVEKVRNAELGCWDYGRPLSTHSLCLSATDETRAIAHYDGFCSNHGFSVKVGDSICFPSGSAASGWRAGRVTKVTGRRVEVAGRFNYQRGKGEPFHRMVQKGDLRSYGSKVEAARG